MHYLIRGTGAAGPSGAAEMSTSCHAIEDSASARPDRFATKEEDMKRTITALTTVLLLAASSAYAYGSQWIAANGGAAFPSGDLSDGANTGWLAGAGYGRTLNVKFALGADVNYNGLGKKTIGTAPATVDVQPSIWQYTAEGYWMLGMKSKEQYPYAKGGLGAYSVNSDQPGESTKTKFGFNAGLGWNKLLKNGKTSFGIDGMYHWITPSSDFKTASGDNATLSYFIVSAHLGWGIGGNSTSVK